MARKQQKGQDKNTGLPSRRVRYQVAMSLDGFIAGPNGEADWIIMDPEIDFKAGEGRVALRRRVALPQLGGIALGGYRRGRRDPRPSGSGRAPAGRPGKSSRTDAHRSQAVPKNGYHVPTVCGSIKSSAQKSTLSPHSSMFGPNCNELAVCRHLRRGKRDFSRSGSTPSRKLPSPLRFQCRGVAPSRAQLAAGRRLDRAIRSTSHVACSRTHDCRLDSVGL
jgi:hypothetical protein